MRVFCPPPLPSAPLYPLFNFRFARGEKIGGLFKDNLPENYFEKSVQYVATPDEADAIILPNNFTYSNAAVDEYIGRFADMGENHHKPVFIFSCGDHTDTVFFDKRVRVFRYSIYKATMSPQDICTPTLTEDLGRGGITLRTKQGIPTVSFCGKAGFSTNKEFFAGLLKTLWYQAIGLVRPALRARIRGVFWRIWSIKVFQNSQLVKNFFIIRKTFSGAEKTIELDPTQARKEFIDSLTNTDFVLAPKGDGNYSNRFLEALSMGRFPVVPDTDCVFPFEDKIDYSKLVVKVPMSDLRRAPQLVKEFYDALTAEEYTGRQKLAREVFEKYLRQDAFFKILYATK